MHAKSQILSDESLDVTNPQAFRRAIFFFALCDSNKFLDEILHYGDVSYFVKLFFSVDDNSYKQKCEDTYLHRIRLHRCAERAVSPSDKIS